MYKGEDDVLGEDEARSHNKNIFCSLGDRKRKLYFVYTQIDSLCGTLDPPILIKEKLISNKKLISIF